MRNRLFLLLPIKTNFVFVVTMFLLGTICDIFVETIGSRFLGLVELWFDVYLMAVMLTLLPSSVRKVVRGILYCLCYSLALIDLYLYYATGQPITPQLVTLIALTDAREAKEAVNAYFTIKPLLSPWILIWMLLVLHLSVLRKWSVRFSLWKYIEERKYLSRALEMLLFLSIAISAGVIWEDKAYKYYRLLLGRSELETQAEMDLSPKIYYKHPTYRFMYSAREYLNYHKIVKQLSKNINSGSVDTCTYTSPLMVFIIGESYNKHHSQLYGYEKETTPYQLSQNRQGNLVFFEDAVSSWNTTCESLQNIFSLSYYGDTAAWYKKPFFTTLFRKADYDVTFLSNQYTLDHQQSVSNFIEDIFINIPNISKMQFSHRNANRYTYDEELLQDIDTIRLCSKPSILILHFMGSHFDFNKRYPSTHAYFKPQDYHRPNLSNAELEILAHYDNSIRYNDEVLKKIITLFEKKNAIIIHIADHGERVFDYDNNWGRSLGNSFAEVTQQFEIPMWIWCSDEYKRLHPEVWSAIIKNHKKPYMTDAISHTLLNIAGIQTPYYTPEVDILSEKYNSHRKRIIKETVDYDTIVK